SLYLNCPNLSELNLNSCKALLPEKLVLQCSKLESVHAVGCPYVVVQAVQTKDVSAEEKYQFKDMMLRIENALLWLEVAKRARRQNLTWHVMLLSDLEGIATGTVVAALCPPVPFSH
nr:hypothetical protein [Tanacetum cinerariifolium]